MYLVNKIGLKIDSKFKSAPRTLAVSNNAPCALADRIKKRYDSGLGRLTAITVSQHLDHQRKMYEQSGGALSAP